MNNKLNLLGLFDKVATQIFFMTTEITTAKELQKMDPVFGQLSFDNHEQIVFCNDKDTGLKAIIGIHNSVLGPALGGTRMWNHANEWEALNGPQSHMSTYTTTNLKTQRPLVYNYLDHLSSKEETES